MFTPIAVGNPQRENVYRQLKEAIVSGAIKPNERIVETTYAKIFHVSRTPVREAIRMLERDELVIYEPKKGAIARAPLSEEEMEEVYTIRSTLQMLSVEATVRNITDEEIRQMASCNDACLQALESGDETIYFQRLDQFNDVLTKSCRMPLLIKLIEQIELYNPSTTFVNASHTRLREFAVYGEGRRHAAVEEHIAICDALLQRDEEALRSALQIHTTNVKAAALAGYQEYRKMLAQQRK
jgi:DNA-binding GntR family transcriptional regulator